jgi:hypothetical protein
MLHLLCGSAILHFQAIVPSHYDHASVTSMHSSIGRNSLGDRLPMRFLVLGVAKG